MVRSTLADRENRVRHAWLLVALPAILVAETIHASTYSLLDTLTLLALEDRMQALAIANEAAAARLAELAAAEDSLRRTLAIAETAAEDDLAGLTRVYETMKPKDAAALFERMDARFAAGFLARMRPEAGAGIMAGLSPEAAHAISVVLAGRNARTE